MASLHHSRPKMKLLHLLNIVCALIIYTSLARAQQSYVGDPRAVCDLNNIESNDPIYYGYSCNGQKSCKTSLTIRSQYPYNTLSSIATLLGVDEADINQANPNYTTNVVEGNKLVYAPITCSCGNSPYYTKSAGYTVLQDDTYFSIANNTFQGLTTCHALINENTGRSTSVGATIGVPLRCACPTNNQRAGGIDSLFSYVVGNGDTISSISTQLKVDSKSILNANQLPENSTIYAFTTLLIPVINNQTTSQPSHATLSKGAIAGIVAAAAAALAGGGAAVRFGIKDSNFFCCNSTNETHHHSGTEGNDPEDASKDKKDKNSPNTS